MGSSQSYQSLRKDRFNKERKKRVQQAYDSDQMQQMYPSKRLHDQERIHQKLIHPKQSDEEQMMDIKRMASKSEKQESPIVPGEAQHYQNYPKIEEQMDILINRSVGTSASRCNEKEAMVAGQERPVSANVFTEERAKVEHEEELPEKKAQRIPVSLKSSKKKISQQSPLLNQRPEMPEEQPVTLPTERVPDEEKTKDLNKVYEEFEDIENKISEIEQKMDYLQGEEAKSLPRDKYKYQIRWCDEMLTQLLIRLDSISGGSKVRKHRKKLANRIHALLSYLEEMGKPYL